jgi:hypothetical protein
MNTLVLLACIFSLTCALPFEFDFNVAQNEKTHRTSDYKIANDVDPSDDARMLVRRGSTFTVFLADDNYPLYFQLVPYDVVRDRENTKVAVTVKLVNSIVEDPTTFQVKRTPGSSKTQYDIYIPYRAPVSMFHWVVVNGTTTVPMTNELAILFNPWNPKDDVYNSDPNFIKEYISNSQGVLWYGSAGSMGSMGWDYAQYNYAILEVTFYFLYNVPWEKRGDIITVSRALSSYVNVNDNNGLIWGRWSGSYDDGKSPMYWTGSLAIYEQYKTTLSGVKYGQCWVFGGCLTSAGRSLGIPARTLTNFESAHESPSSSSPKYQRELDMFFDASGSYIDTEGGSIWNFHVWCEFWFARSDLPSAYSGWQAVDATPQERSDGLMQMGPASVNAIKALATQYRYDTDFVASEVGSTVNKWIQYDTGKQKHPYKSGFWLLESDPKATGLKMSTKAVGSSARSDITSTYKSVTHIPHFSTRYIVKAPGITFEIVYPSTVYAGDNFSLTVVADCARCSPSSQSFLEVSGLIQMVTYTGDVVKILRSGSINVTLDAPHEEQGLTVLPGEYIPYFKDNYVIEYFAFVKYFENGIYNGTYALKNGRFDIVFPPLALNVVNKTDEKFYLSVSWTNPLNIPLSNGIVRISGAYIADQDNWVGAIAPHSTINLRMLEVYHFSDGEPILVNVKLLTQEIPTVNSQITLQ